MRYFFDVQREGSLFRDVDGMDLRNRSTVEEEAIKSIAEMARDLIQVKENRSSSRRLVIKVRDEAGPFLEVEFTLQLRYRCQ